MAEKIGISISQMFGWDTPEFVGWRRSLGYLLMPSTSQGLPELMMFAKPCAMDQCFFLLFDIPKIFRRFAAKVKKTPKKFSPLRGDFNQNITIIHCFYTKRMPK